eukprot:PITA_27723
MSPSRSGYKELGLELVKPLQDQPRKSRRPPMADEKKDEVAGDPIKILLEEALERQRNAMMDSFAQILQRLPRGDASASSSYSGNVTPFKSGKDCFRSSQSSHHVNDWWETYCEQKDESTGSLFSTAPTWNDFRDAIKEQYYPVKSYEDKYIKWTTLRQGRDQGVPEFTNNFHTLRTQLGIKDSELHLVLKYRGCLHRYIQEEMDFLNISSLGTAYRYAVKIEQKFKQKKREFGSSNPKPKGQSQGRVTQNNPSKPQEKNNTTKPKKDIGKLCEFHKSPTHNTKPDKENGKGKQIIDADPSTTIATAKIQKNEPEDPEEGDRLFHSLMWVKGSPLQFIVDSGSQKNLISAEVVKQLGLPTTPHLQPYKTIGFMKDKISKFASSAAFPTASNHSQTRIPEVAPPTAASLIIAKKGSKLIS